jgi:hypothetical protein
MTTAVVTVVLVSFFNAMLGAVVRAYIDVAKKPADQSEVRGFRAALTAFLVYNAFAVVGLFGYWVLQSDQHPLAKLDQHHVAPFTGGVEGAGPGQLARAGGR